MSLSEELREVCQHMNISLSDLAHRAGLSPQNLYMRLKRNSIDWEEFNQYLRLMGVQCEHRILYPGEAAYSPSDETIHMLESELNLNRKKVHFINGLRADCHATIERINKCVFTALENPDTWEMNLRQTAVEAARLKDSLIAADQAMGRSSISELSSVSYTKEKNQEYRTISSLSQLYDGVIYSDIYTESTQGASLVYYTTPQIDRIPGWHAPISLQERCKLIAAYYCKEQDREKFLHLSSREVVMKELEQNPYYRFQFVFWNQNAPRNYEITFLPFRDAKNDIRSVVVTMRCETTE